MGRQSRNEKKSCQKTASVEKPTAQLRCGCHIAERLESRTLLSLSPVSVPTPFMTTGSIPTNFIQYNGLTYFSNNSATAGNALWKTDGTAAGTSLVLPYCQSQGIETEAVSNGKLYFIIYDAGTNQSALWETNGTETGTALLQTFPGMISNGDLAGVSGTLFFSAPNGNEGWQLWKTDGTTAGTVVLTDINAPRGLNPFRLTDVNGTLFFSANDGINGYQLWKSDGTSAGTVMVADIPLGSDPTGPWYLTNVNGTLYFTANDAAHGWELWKTDGTANGTVLVDDIIPGRNSSSPSTFVNFNGTLFFTAFSVNSGLGLWKTDGTAAGTVKVADVPGSTVRAISSSGDKLFLIVNTVPPTTFPERDALYCTDASAGNLQLLAANTSQNLAVIGNEAFFTAWTPQYGSEPWRTDGTLAGTQVLADILPGGGSSHPQTLVAVGSQLFFAANDGIHGLQLWKSDGTAAGTEMVSDMGSTIQDALGVGKYVATIADEEYFIFAGTLFGYNLNSRQAVPLCEDFGHDFTVSGDFLYFTYSSYPPYTYLMRTDGTAAGTVGLGAFASIPTYGGPLASPLYGFGGNIYFNATVVGDTTSSQAGLWESDGTLAGTRLLSHSTGGAQLFTHVGNQVFFFGYTASSVLELWITDGTPAGTQLVGSGYNAGPTAYNPNYRGQIYAAPVDLNGRLIWESNVDGTGVQLLSTDGTAAGTTPISAFTSTTPIEDASDPAKTLVVLNGVLYFESGSGLWRSDGTLAGTQLLKSGVTGYGLTIVGNYLFFIQNPSSSVYTLWRSDGTAGGTVALKTSTTSSSSTAPAIDDDLVDVNGEAYFSVPEASNPSQKDLWASDGTPVGTVLAAGNLPQLVTTIPPTIRSQDGNLYVQEYNVGLGGDFVFTPSVRGRVFNDANNNGTLDPAESGLSGVTVYLDLNNNGLLDAGDISDITSPGGYYTFAVLPAGAYTVRQVVPAGCAATAPLGYSGQAVVTDGQSASGPVFGDALISSIVIDDAYYLSAANNFGKQATFATGDVNGDGTVNLADILLITRYLGQPLPASVTQPALSAHTLTARRRV